MNFYEFFMTQLQKKGMFNLQAQKVMSKVMEKNPNMKGLWKEQISAHSEKLKNILWLSVEQEALDFIKKDCPKIWFRPIFDKEHPLRKKIEKKYGNIESIK